MLDTDLTVRMWHMILSLVSDLTEHWGLSMFYTYLPRDLTVWYWYIQTATDRQYNYSRYLGISLSLSLYIYMNIVYGKQFAATVSRWSCMTNALRQLATFHFTSLRLTEAVAVLTCGSGEGVIIMRLTCTLRYLSNTMAAQQVCAADRQTHRKGHNPCSAKNNSNNNSKKLACNKNSGGKAPALPHLMHHDVGNVAVV